MIILFPLSLILSVRHASIWLQNNNVPFIALQYRDFRLLWLGQLISQAGSMMQVVAINWHISVLTNYNPLALGIVGLSRVVPIIFFSLVGGAVADARDRRKVMMITQSAMAIFAAMSGSVDRSRRANRVADLSAQCAGGQRVGV